MAINETTNNQGGYTVPIEYEKELLRLLGSYGVMPKVFKIKYTNTDAGKISELTNLPTVYYPSEGAEGTESSLTFGQKSWALKRFKVVVKASTDWEEDTFTSVQETIIEPMLIALAKDIDRVSLLGDGTATYNSITGLANTDLSSYPSNVIDMGMGEFSLESIYEGQTLISENDGMSAALIVSPRGLKSLSLVQDGDGRYIFRPYDSATSVQNMGAIGAINNTIPVFEAKALKDYETANHKGIAFMVDPTKTARFIYRYKTMKVFKEKVNLRELNAYQLYTRLDFQVLFPQLLVRYENLGI